MTNVTKKIVSFVNDRIEIISDINFNIREKKAEHLTANIVMLCTQGKGELYLNNQLIEIKEGDLLMATENASFQGKNTSDDFKSCGFCLSKHFFEELSNIPIGFINTAIYVVDNPVSHLSKEAITIFTQYYNLIRTKLNENADFKHHQLVTNFLFQAFMYEFHDIIEDIIDKHDIKFTSGENIFRQFFELLLHTYPKPRSVEWYANKLNITPKYLSSVIKHCSGKTASTIINHYVLEDVKRNLMRPDKTIKEIVNELDFPSISFFGKYCKKNLGMSPKFYRIEKSETPNTNIYI